MRRPTRTAARRGAALHVPTARSIGRGARRRERTARLRGRARLAAPRRRSSSRRARAAGVAGAHRLGGRARRLRDRGRGPRLGRRGRLDDASFRVYYLFGALLTAPLLGVGSLLRVGRAGASPRRPVYTGLARRGRRSRCRSRRPSPGRTCRSAQDALALWPGSRPRDRRPTRSGRSPWSRSRVATLRAPPARKRPDPRRHRRRRARQRARGARSGGAAPRGRGVLLYAASLPPASSAVPDPRGPGLRAAPRSRARRAEARTARATALGDRPRSPPWAITAREDPQPADGVQDHQRRAAGLRAERVSRRSKIATARSCATARPATWPTTSAPTCTYQTVFGRQEREVRA